MSKYRMYVDEVGNADLKNSAEENHRFLVTSKKQLLKAWLFLFLGISAKRFGRLLSLKKGLYKTGNKFDNAKE